MSNLSKPVAPEDLNRRSHYTILSLHPQLESTVRASDDSCSRFKMPEAPFPPGIPFKILSFSLPFLMVKIHSHHGMSQPLVLDTRTLTLAKVSNHYARSLCDCKKRKKKAQVKAQDTPPSPVEGEKKNPATSISSLLSLLQGISQNPPKDE